jgi:hypothetical protein
MVEKLAKYKKPKANADFSSLSCKYLYQQLW